ncbi:MAG: DUF92 domain-containing protein [Candidatus Micrarchaeia archaeon]|jgi:uncharacterized protein (TIGR00297 family)
MKILTLNPIGLGAAIAFALLIAAFTGQLAGSFISLILVFLVAGWLVTKYGYERKRELTLYEYERGWENVLANGAVPAACAILYYFDHRFLWAYVGSVAAIMADKFASEIGVLGGKPYMLPSFKQVKFGTSGAVSVLGTLASWDGGIVIGAAAFLLFPGVSIWDALVISAIGMAGSFIDTLVGIWETKGTGTKATTNFICALSGAIMGYFLFA